MRRLLVLRLGLLLVLVLRVLVLPLLLLVLLLLVLLLLGGGASTEPFGRGRWGAGARGTRSGAGWRGCVVSGSRHSVGPAASARELDETFLGRSKLFENFLTEVEVTFRGEGVPGNGYISDLSVV